MEKKHHNTTHGMEGSPEYRTWVDMRRRCNLPHRPDYHRYGGRGISVCERWDVFENFFEDMGPRPSPKHTIDRKENDGPYSKENCRWATKKEQGGNTRTNRIIEVDGISMTVTAASEKYGISWNVVFQRLNRGWDPERALKMPPLQPNDPRGKRGPYKIKPRS